MRRTWLAGASIAAFAFTAVAAHAEQRGATAVDEVVVTAQKRSENIQTVPMSVSAVSADTLDTFHVTKLSDFADYVPGLQVTNVRGYPGENNITIRGINTGGTGATVATLVDDIPVNSASSLSTGGFVAPDLLPYDIARVEVLAGPQGTLYGASALGGVLKYVTTTPGLDGYEFRVGADVSGVYNGREPGRGARAEANLPIVPGKLAISLSGAEEYSPGYIDNVATGQNAYNPGRQLGGRLAVLFKPNDRLSLKLGALIDKQNFVGSSSVATTLTGVELTPTYGRYENLIRVPSQSHGDFELYSANLNYDFGAATLTSVTGYSKARNKLILDSSGGFAFLGVLVPVEDHFDGDKFTQEVRLASNGDGRLSWTLGGYFTNENNFNSIVAGAKDPATGASVPGLDPLFAAATPNRYQEYAAFGNASYKISDAFDINGGIRFSHDKQSGSSVSTGSLIGPEVDTAYNPADENVTTWSVGARYHFSPKVMAYGRISTGYQPGGANAIIPQTVNAPETYAADTLTNYEVGLKSQFFDNRLLFNISLFHIKWSNLQVLETDGVFGFVANSGSATSNGFELTTAYWLTPDLRLGFNAGYSDATIDQDQPFLNALKGEPLPLSAKFSDTVTIDYTRPLPHDSTLHLGAIWRYVGPRNTLFLAQPGAARLPSYTSADLSAGVSHGRWSANLFVRNVWNEYAFLNTGGFADAPILTPRTIGFSLDARF